MSAASTHTRPIAASANGPTSLAYRNDTIVALATPPGRGGVAVVRLSGPQALSAAAQLCPAPLADNPRHAYLTPLTSPGEGGPLDRALVTYFKAPASFTGEDVVEFSTHGGHVTPGLLIRQLTGLGIRRAEAGEFSLRAFLNGKLDLAEAEALNDLVSSLSARGQRAATENLAGGLSRAIAAARETLIQLLTVLEHELDFSEDEIDATSYEDIRKQLSATRDQLLRLKATAPYGRVIRDGVRIILAGPPNAGKSSLFNALIGHERAIVTEIPGTTRDSLEAWLELAGFPVCLVDTAGLHDAGDTLEQLGMEHSRRQLADADIILLLDPSDPTALPLENELREHQRVIYVQSKVDSPVEPPATNGSIPTSIVRPDGLEQLTAHLAQALTEQFPAGESAIIGSERQLESLNGALAHLDEADAQLAAGLSLDIVSAELRQAAHSLAVIIGETSSEELIQRIFSEFCVGK